jgi:uncharacterized membrane protein YfhO
MLHYERSVEYTSQPIKSPRDVVAIEEAGTNVYDFRIQSSANSLLLVSQVYYSGWRATVDGKRVPVLAANYALTGIPVPAAIMKSISFLILYRSRSGWAISIVSILMAGALITLAEPRL